MAPSATATQSLSSKVKRPVPPGIQTNGINSSTSSPSPSMSVSRLPAAAKYSPNLTSNGLSNGTGPRSINRTRRDAPAQLLGRGQRNSSAGLRSASLVGEAPAAQPAEPQPYVMTDGYILKKHRGSPPSLIVHLHPTHFRFDQQDGSFSYKSPMKMVIEHIRARTIPHDLLEFMPDVPFYDGCMIVQLHDHKSLVPSQSADRTITGPGKSIPFSVHNYTAYLTPSSYVPYPTQNTGGKSKDVNGDDKGKTAEQMDKENMPAPNLPGEVQRNKPLSPSKKPKIITVVLHPTPPSNHIDLALKAREVNTAPEDRRGSVTGGPLSATVPPTPTTAAPPTPSMAMAPPAKRMKRTRPELDVNNVRSFESQVTLVRTAELKLDPVVDASESAALLESLAHPMHSEKPPAPKTRKRTVAEMAADEALAADQERFMLAFDERLSSNIAGAPGSSNPVNGDGPGVSFQPQFERFKTLENIKANHEENKRQEKLRREEAERKQRVEQERNKLEENQKRIAEEKNRTTAMHQAHEQQQQQAAMQMQLQQQEAQRRRSQQLQQAQQNLAGNPTQVQTPHAHPVANGIVVNGMNSQPQRFHQQVSQAQASSPIVRNGTPHSHSSPTVNGMGNAPMQHSTSSMGGSPPRPGSVVQQNHHPMGAPTPQGMVPQRSQQSHAGTPRMPNSTPNIASTPLNRQMSQTPRISQGSPLQGPLGQSPQVMMNGQPMQMNQAQMQQVLAQQRMQQLRQQQVNGQNITGMMNGHPMTQQQMMQAQAMRAQQMSQQNTPMAAQYARQLQQMGQQAANMPQNMNGNFVNGNPAMNGNAISMQHMQRIQQMQMVQQQQAQQQLHQQQQQQQQQAGPEQQAAMREQMIQRQINQLANQFYVQQRQNMMQQYPNGQPPPDVDQALKARCSMQARVQFENSMRQRQQMAMAQRMNAMQNGGGM